MNFKVAYLISLSSFLLASLGPVDETSAQVNQSQLHETRSDVGNPLTSVPGPWVVQLVASARYDDALKMADKIKKSLPNADVMLVLQDDLYKTWIVGLTKTDASKMAEEVKKVSGSGQAKESPWIRRAPLDGLTVVFTTPSAVPAKQPVVDTGNKGSKIPPATYKVTFLRDPDFEYRMESLASNMAEQFRRLNLGAVEITNDYYVVLITDDIKNAEQALNIINMCGGFSRFAGAG